MPAHGVVLPDLLVSRSRAAELRDSSRTLPSWELTPRQLCDLELLMNGGCWPLCGFMTRGDYDAVCHGMRLADGALWPIPITLDVTEEFARRLEAGAAVALREPEGVMLAVLHVEEVWKPDRLEEAHLVCRTTDPGHPGVAALLDRAHPWYVGGRIEEVQLPTHYDFSLLGWDGLWTSQPISACLAFETLHDEERVPSTTYEPRRPANGTLYRIVLDHFETFRSQAGSIRDGEGLPRFVEQEFRDFLECGWLAGGFARFRCGACGVDRLVPFSCKGRGFCPSCGGRRMAERAAHLVDHVLPTCRCGNGS